MIMAELDSVIDDITILYSSKLLMINPIYIYIYESYN